MNAAINSTSAMNVNMNNMNHNSNNVDNNTSLVSQVQQAMRQQQQHHHHHHHQQHMALSQMEIENQMVAQGVSVANGNNGDAANGVGVGVK